MMLAIAALLVAILLGAFVFVSRDPKSGTFFFFALFFRHLIGTIVCETPIKDFWIWVVKE